MLVYHLSAADAVRELDAARARGQEVYGEACLPYLLLDEAAYDEPLSRPGAARRPAVARLLASRCAVGRARAGRNRHRVDRSRPAPSIRGADGERVIPAGTSGLEVRLALVHTFGVRTGRLSLQRFVDACCTRPAELFGLVRKGRLEAGYDADIVIFDPERRVTLTAADLHSDIDHSTYEGWVCEGAPVTTIVRGEIVVADGELQVEAGHGHFVEREARR